MAIPGPAGTAIPNSTGCDVSKKEMSVTWRGCLSTGPRWLLMTVTYLSKCRDTTCPGWIPRPWVCHVEGSPQPCSSPHPPGPLRSIHICGDQVALASTLFSQFSRLECLAGPGGQLATPEAEAQQAVGRGKGLGSRFQRKDPVWNPDPVSQSQSWAAQEAPADSGFSLLRAAEVSVSKLLVIPFFN